MHVAAGEYVLRIGHCEAVAVITSVGTDAIENAVVAGSEPVPFA
jgi:hypothetical protein